MKPKTQQILTNLLNADKIDSLFRETIDYKGE